ncbi:MAG: anthranilate synthase component I family protein [Moraxella sp.]|nr:anthranilate synthase component I family protein [Moraxella sp.]
MQKHPLPHLPHNPAELTALLITTLKEQEWHIFWLYNNGKPVIGLLPKVVWALINDNGQLNTIIYHFNQNHYTTQSQKSDFNTYQSFILNYYNQQKTYFKENNPNNDTYINGVLGYVSYDIGANQLNHSIKLSNGLLALFGHYDCYLSLENNTWQLCYEKQDERFDLIIKLLSNLNNKLISPSPIYLTPKISKTAYMTAFHKTQDYLKAGDAYQINLTQPFVGISDDKLPLINHLPNLFNHTHAPFCGYLKMGQQEIASVSPELFFKFQKNNGDIILITKPIKGTRPRHNDPAIDEQFKNDLAKSEKDLAENVMIVDLLRNDLGKYAKFGAVSVPKKFAVESFSNVHHLVSTVQATLGDVPALTVLFDSLPAGSITGSPKKRACELIDELERGKRGAYCGTMGYLNFDETGQWNVLIRTLQSDFDGQKVGVSAWAGGGVTVLSGVDDEYQECLDKVGQIRKILAM